MNLTCDFVLGIYEELRHYILVHMGLIQQTEWDILPSYNFLLN